MFNCEGMWLDCRRLQLQCAPSTLHAGSVLASDSSLAMTRASYWSEEAGSNAAAVSPGTAADSAVAFDLHWENQSGIKDQQETGNTFLLATTTQDTATGPQCDLTCSMYILFMINETGAMKIFWKTNQRKTSSVCKHDPSTIEFYF